MAKELMEIGGFITEGAEIVNHDASLSGNGTVDSPLGLNETVLWENPSFASGDVDLGTTFQLSELASNFERIRISWSRWGESQGKNKTDCNVYTEYDMQFGSVIRNRVTVVSMFYAGTNESDPYLCGSMLTGFADGTTITCDKGWQNVVGNSTVQKAKLYCRPWKVVGINRIANN